MEFRVLGPLEVVADGSALQLGGPKQRAVLATLVQRANEVVSTDALVDSLWWGEPPRSAVVTVRTYISRLRQLLVHGDRSAVVSRPPGYVLDIAPEQVDAHRFEQLVGRAGRALAAGRPAVAAGTLDEALGLWRGDVLADLADLHALRPTITRLGELRLAAREDRITAELALGHHAEVVGELEALVAQHPLRERLWGQLIVALYRCERQADALVAYQALRTTLADRTGLEPGAELRALERDVLDQSEALRWRPPSIPARAARSALAVPGAEPDDIVRAPASLPAGLVRGPHDPPFVGRARERALLAGGLDAARNGTFGAVVVTGPAGIGKTALAGWLAEEAGAVGAHVVLGRADEGTGGPYRPFDEAIGQWAARADAVDLGLLGDGPTAALARVVPVLAERLAPGDETLHQGVNPSVDRQRLFTAIARWIEVLAAPGPAVVVLDDVHWADPGALLALRHLLRHPPAAGALLLVTHRPVPDNAALSDLRAAAAAGGHAAHLALAGLSETEVLELLPQAPGDDPPAAGRSFAAALERRTGGNPFFIHETVRHLADCGAFDPGRDAPLTAAGPEVPFAAFGVPPAVADVITRRLDQLPGPTVAVLGPGAVLGFHVDVAVLARVVDLPELAVVEALEPALAAGLVEPDGGPDRFAFAHALVREAILDGVAPSRRIRAHWRAGEVIAGLEGPHAGARAGSRLGEIAHHLAAGVRGGDVATAVAANVRAGRHALVSLAFEDARAHFTVATGLLGSAGGIDPDLAYDAWLGLGHAAGALAEVEHQRDGYLTAAAIAGAEGWDGRLARAAVGLATHAAAVVPGRDDSSREAAALMAQARRSVDEPTVEHCLLLALEGVHAAVGDDIGRARCLAAATQDMATALGDPTAEAGAQLARCWSLVGGPEPADVRAAADAALALVPMPRLRPEARLLVHELVLPLLAVPALQRADHAGYAAVRDQVRGRAEAQGSIHGAGSVRSWDAALALCRGRLDEAERLTTSIPGAVDGVIWDSVSQLQSTVVWIERGHHADVARWLIEYLAVVPGAIGTRAMLALLHATAGNATEAAHEVDALRRRRSIDGLGWSGPLVLRHLAEVAARLDDRDLAAELLPLLQAYTGQLLVSFAGATVEAAADRSIGQVRAVLGQHDAAVGHLEAAYALEEAFGATLLAARTSFWHAWTLRRRAGPGDGAAAVRLLDRSARQARTIGAAHLVTEVEHLQRVGA